MRIATKSRRRVASSSSGFGAAYRIRADGKHRYGAFGTGRQGDPDPRSATISGLRKRARRGAEGPAEIHVGQRIAVWREDRGRSGKCVDRGREQIAQRARRPIGHRTGEVCCHAVKLGIGRVSG